MLTQHIIHIKVKMDKFILKVNNNANAIRFLTFMLGRISANMKKKNVKIPRIIGRFRSPDGWT